MSYEGILCLLGSAAFFTLKEFNGYKEVIRNNGPTESCCYKIISNTTSKFISTAAAAAAAAAKSLQSCPTLCDPRDGSPRGSPVPGILQARTLEWVAISFSNA